MKRGLARALVPSTQTPYLPRNRDLQEIAALTKARFDAVTKYRDAYRQYCWPVTKIADLKLAPFHLRATEGAVHSDRQHTWHMETLARLCAADSELLLATPHKLVDVNDASMDDAMPHDQSFIARDRMVIEMKTTDPRRR